MDTKEIKMNGAAFNTAHVQSFQTAKDFIKSVDPVIYSHIPDQREQLLTDIYQVAMNLKKQQEKKK